MNALNVKQELRLSEKELSQIKKIKDFIDADIYIFGSRLEMNKRGGDIDLYIVPKSKISAREKVLLKMKIRSFLEDELLIPVDVVFDNVTLRKEVLTYGYKVD
ncbi:MAG: nucleotidyltransferase domain-containing protein [Epsilonproteobacteria bacterium]|nr:nucleotidyltransferase domain-containing protein [Campylobacterota bacterium]